MNLDDKNYLRQVGARIRDKRLENRWTQAELAQRCELHRTFIGSVERGERNLSILNVRRIAKVLRISTADLLYGLR
jgi:transcriptional regulator with XRE-family HTH domain